MRNDIIGKVPLAVRLPLFLPNWILASASIKSSYVPPQTMPHTHGQAAADGLAWNWNDCGPQTIGKGVLARRNLFTQLRASIDIPHVIHSTFWRCTATNLSLNDSHSSSHPLFLPWFVAFPFHLRKLVPFFLVRLSVSSPLTYLLSILNMLERIQGREGTHITRCH